MHETERDTLARDTMLRFAQKTGLSPSSSAPVRYLWTDAYAVCNFLELHRRAGGGKYLRLALDLVEQVHEILGKHREDDSRSGWISGMGEEEGRRHPTAGGLRIGKSLPDRKPHQPTDANLEWDRDGQYFHYLTKWMHALRQVGCAVGDEKYNRWASELGKVACKAFARQSADGIITGLYWKMNVDLAYPVVPSMGHHDPLDGYVTLLEIDRSLRRAEAGDPAFDLSKELNSLRRLCVNRDWVTTDALGIGGLLFDACRLVQLLPGDDREFAGATLTSLLEASHIGLRHFLSSGILQENAAQRLAFRELGLSIGLHAIPVIRQGIEQADGIKINSHPEQLLPVLEQVVPLANAIEEFWLHPTHRRQRSWRDHENINMVMLASSLIPNGVLKL
ncbi:MAG: hypothetical protein K8F25_09600 [Fimbriimonadaceae bacterium]|nr:hypothetical protein [Alphaproteobacteria bacterium]